MLTTALASRSTAPTGVTDDLIGVLPGEGIGPEVVPAALSLLPILAQRSGRHFDIRQGGPIGYDSLAACGKSLSAEVTHFVEQIFASGGALFCGPGGERFVYDLRVRFDLFCKFTPLQPLAALRNLGPVVPARLDGVDIVTVRENSSGLYQGEWSLAQDASGHQVARHAFQYREAEVDRIIAVAMRLAGNRKRRLCVAVKPGGIPSVSRLWIERAEHLAVGGEVDLTILEIDNTLYQLVAHPAQFDVIVSPNMFGDVIADCGSLLLGSRGLSYSGNFGPDCRAAYQTGHGAARDIAGQDCANPLGQMFSLAMMLEESFAWPTAANAIRLAIGDVLAAGQRPFDLAEAGCEVLGTRALAERVCEALDRRLDVMDL